MSGQTGTEVNKAIGQANRERIRRFFADHLCATNVECAKALDMSVFVVGRHVKAIREEWKSAK